MKKLLFSAYTLDIGGVETSLVTLLNCLVKKYDITLILEKKQGVFLKELSDKIKVIEYAPNKSKILLLRRSVNLFKRICFILKYKNKFDFSASFATDSKMGSFCARVASSNNALWVHSDYLSVFSNNEKNMSNFFEFVKFNKFKNIVCVSTAVKNSLVKIFNEVNDRVIVINNLIDYEKILIKSKEKIAEKRETGVTTFLSVCRHDEHSKRLTRLINIAEILKKEKYKFKILLIGEGQDTNLYKKTVKEKDLENEIIFLGIKENPYPYFKISNCIILTSDYEGYPVVFIESMVLDLPIITTDISDAKIDIQGKYGIVTEKDEKSIYKAMEKFIKEGYQIKNKFNPQIFNKEIFDKIQTNLIGGR